jgi:hypothetical protein
VQEWQSKQRHKRMHLMLEELEDAEFEDEED